MCFDFLYNFFWNILHSKKNSRDIIINVQMSVCYVPVIRVKFYWELNFLDRFSKILKYQISLKSFQCEPSYCMWMDG